MCSAGGLATTRRWHAVGDALPQRGCSRRARGRGAVLTVNPATVLAELAGGGCEEDKAAAADSEAVLEECFQMDGGFFGVLWA